MKGRCWSQPEGTEFLPAACKALGKAGSGALPMAWGRGGGSAGAAGPREGDTPTPHRPGPSSWRRGGAAGAHPLALSSRTLFSGDWNENVSGKKYI